MVTLVIERTGRDCCLRWDVDQLAERQDEIAEKRLPPVELQGTFGAPQADKRKDTHLEMLVVWRKLVRARCNVLHSFCSRRNTCSREPFQAKSANASTHLASPPSRPTLSYLSAYRLSTPQVPSALKFLCNFAPTRRTTRRTRLPLLAHIPSFEISPSLENHRRHYCCKIN